MEDIQIIDLYWARDQMAITATAEKYGGYCAAVARNILASEQDTEECVNDTWLRAWNSMPPQRPGVLAAFLGTITRNLAFNRFRRGRTEKRGSGELPLVLEELEECVSGRESVEGEYDRRELLAAINAYLDGLSPLHRTIFVRRYWYADRVGAIAQRLNMTENHVSMILTRLRRKLREHLMKEGFDL